MAEYTPNSHKYREEQAQKAESREKKATLVSGKAQTKNSPLRDLASGLISEDAKDIKSYILTEFILPGIANLIYDAGSNTLSALLFGIGKRRPSSSQAKTPYREYYDRDRSRGYRRDASPDTRGRVDSYKDIFFETRGDAEVVLEQMKEDIARCDWVSVNDLYDYAGVADDNYTYANYGWKDLSIAKAIHTRDGWMLKLPRPYPLD